MSVDVDYLIPYLRLRLGDLTPATYRYLDEWLSNSLIASVRVLGRYWKFKYLVDESGLVSRNPNYYEFTFEESFGVIEGQDEDVIVLKAAIIVLQGNLENSAWSISSWKDSEISFSNLEQSRSRSSSLDRLLQDFRDLVVAPTKRLAVPSKQSLPGYLNNPYENKDKI